MKVKIDLSAVGRGAISSMQKFTLSNLTLSDLKQIVELDEADTPQAEWTQVEEHTLTPEEKQQLEPLLSRLFNQKIHLFNEATIWARAIYPLLLLAERDNIQAWSSVPLQTCYANFELEGIADGALGKTVAGRLEAPYLVILETKRGVEAQNPIFQLYGQLLAAAHLNWELTPRDPQEIFGCYTIADSWTFVRAIVSGLDIAKPTLYVESSREYAEKVDAETILKLLKVIVARYCNASTEAPPS